MFCRNCGKEIDADAFACMGCGCDPRKGNKFCHNCGVVVNPAQIVCIKCGVSLSERPSRMGGVRNSVGKSRVSAAVLALLLGAFGAHEFYLGNVSSAVIRLVVTLVGSFFFGIGFIIMSIISIVEGVVYLTMSDDDFSARYVDEKKAWF